MCAAKNNLHEEQSIGKTVFCFFTSFLAGKPTPSPKTRRQREINQVQRHGNKHRHHHHHHHRRDRHGPHEFDREETQGFEYPLNCEISADAGFWEKAHNLQSEAILRRPPQVTIRSSNRLLADLCDGIDALAPRKTHSRRRHREHHHSSAQSEDPILKPLQATARRGKDGMVEKRNKNEVKKPSPAAHNSPSGFGSHRRRRHYDQRYPEVVPNIPPIIKIKAKVSPKAERGDSVRDIHHTLRNRQVTGHSQTRAIPSRTKCNQTHTLSLESRREKSSVNLGKVTAREEASQISDPNSPTIIESNLQEVPPRQNVLRHQGVQIMHPPRPEGWPRSQEATIVNPGISDRDSVLTRVSDFMPKPLKIRSTRTPAKPIPDVSSYSEPSTPAVIPSPRPNATCLLGVVDDDANRESRSTSGRAPSLNQAIHTSPQFNGSSLVRQNRGSAPASYWEDSFPTQAASNEEWLSSNDYTQGSQQICRICHKPCMQDRRVREVEHILCATCEARAFVQPYPTIAKIVDHPASRVGSPASFDRSRRPSGGSTPGRIRGRDTPTSPTLHEGEELQLPPPVPLKTGSQRPPPKDVGTSNFPRGRQVMPLTPPSSSGSLHSRFKDGGSFPKCRTPRVIPPTSPSSSPPMSQISRQVDNPNFPRGGRVRPPIPLAPLDQSIPNSMLFSAGSPTPNTTTTSSSIAQKTNRLQPHENNHLASSSRQNPSSRPSMADSYVTCTHNDDEILRFIPFILDDDHANGLGIYLGSGDEQQQQQQQQQQAAARSPRTPSSPMENREKNFVGRYQNKWGLPYSPSVSTTNEDRHEGVDRPTWYYDHYDRLLGDHHQGGDPGGGGSANHRRRKNK